MFELCLKAFKQVTKHCNVNLHYTAQGQFLNYHLNELILKEMIGFFLHFVLKAKLE